MCSGCPVLPEGGNRGGFSCRKCKEYFVSTYHDFAVRQIKVNNAFLILLSLNPLFSRSIWISVQLLFLALGLKDLQALTLSHIFGSQDIAVQPPPIPSLLVGVCSGWWGFRLPVESWGQDGRQAENQAQSRDILTTGTLLFTATRKLYVSLKQCRSIKYLLWKSVAETYVESVYSWNCSVVE